MARAAPSPVACNSSSSPPMGAPMGPAARPTSTIARPRRRSRGSSAPSSPSCGAAPTSRGWRPATPSPSSCRHLAEVRGRKEELVDKTWARRQGPADREINYWDYRAEQLKMQELAGKTPKLNSGKARQRADELRCGWSGGSWNSNKSGGSRRRRRSSSAARWCRRAVWLASTADAWRGRTTSRDDPAGRACWRWKRSWRPSAGLGSCRATSARTARLRHRVGRARHRPTPLPGGERPRGRRRHGHDHQERDPHRAQPAEQFVLAIVQIEGDAARTPCYVRTPFKREPDFGVTSVNYKLAELLAREVRHEAERSNAHRNGDRRRRTIGDHARSAWRGWRRSGTPTTMPAVCADARSWTDWKRYYRRLNGGAGR